MPLQIMFDVAAWLLLAFWASRAWVLAFGLRMLRKLRDMAIPPEGAILPRIAVIAPALNEEAGIRDALASIAGQSYPDLLILPIDDRSGDRTFALMTEAAALNPVIHPIRITTLPPGWIGKNHANFMGAREAVRRGAEWLLFTDADVRFRRDTLRKAIEHVKENRLDHLAVTPQLETKGWLEAIFVTTFAFWFMTRFQAWRVDEEGSSHFIGIGAFNLVRREAYESIGGHETLALTMTDDMALGKLIRQGGFRQGFVEGEDEVMVRWHSGWLETVRGLYKNSFASLDFNLSRSVIASMLILYVSVGVWIDPFLADGWSRAAAVAALLLHGSVLARTASMLGHGRRMAVSVGFGSWIGGCLLAWVLVASAAITLRQGGVVWRGTLYPIDLLREKQVRL